MNDTPRANRIHIAFFGLRNAGKSTLANAFTGQDLAIVSETPGTTTDPVSKAMEIPPLGPCLVTDTAGLDDVGELGAQRVAKTLAVLATTDVAVWVAASGGPRSRVDAGPCATDGGARSPLRAAADEAAMKDLFLKACADRRVTVLDYRRGDSVAALREKIASLKLADDAPGLLDGLVGKGDRVVCVCPIDAAAPKGRLILPQVQVIRAALDLHATCEVCQVEELASLLEISNCGLQIAEDAGNERRSAQKTLVVTDSQAFGAVRAILTTSRLAASRLGASRLTASRLASPVSCPAEDASPETRDASASPETRDASGSPETRDARLTSFSILFARQKGDLDEYVRGLGAIARLKDGDTVLVAEGCTHHRQCGDIGSVKIPKALAKLSGRKLVFTFASGGDFLEARTRGEGHETREAALVVHCGGCMLSRREVLRRIGVARDAGIPIVNYGMVLAAACGIRVRPGSCCADLSETDAARGGEEISPDR